MKRIAAQQTQKSAWFGPSHARPKSIKTREAFRAGVPVATQYPMPNTQFFSKLYRTNNTIIVRFSDICNTWEENL